MLILLARGVHSGADDDDGGSGATKSSPQLLLSAHQATNAACFIGLNADKDRERSHEN